jgi:hypothetical protein
MIQRLYYVHVKNNNLYSNVNRPTDFYSKDEILCLLTWLVQWADSIAFGSCVWGCEGGGGGVERIVYSHQYTDWEIATCIGGASLRPTRTYWILQVWTTRRHKLRSFDWNIINVLLSSISLLSHCGNMNTNILAGGPC